MPFFMIVKQWPYEAAAIAFEAIPRTLAQNCGVNVIRTMTALQGKVWTISIVCFHHVILFCLQNILIHVLFICHKPFMQHANGENAWIGIDGNTGELTDMKERKV